MARALEPLAKKEAKARQALAGTERGRGQIASGKFSEAIAGEAREQVAAAVGMSGPTLDKAKAADRQAGEGADAFWEVGGP